MPASAAVITRLISMAMIAAMKKANTNGVARASNFQRGAAVLREWGIAERPCRQSAIAGRARQAAPRGGGRSHRLGAL